MDALCFLIETFAAKTLMSPLVFVMNFLVCFPCVMLTSCQSVSKYVASHQTLCPDATPLLGNIFRAGYDSSYRITKILVIM